MSAADHWYLRPLRDVHRCGLELSAEVCELVCSWASKAAPTECGGLLLGWWEGHVPVVVAAVEVPDPAAGRARWTRSEERSAGVLAQVRAAGNPDLGYVGDWHSHPVDVGPSGPDLRELRRLSRQYDEAMLLGVVRAGSWVDVRLARAGRLTTVRRLQGAGVPS